jgi:hypothetical protein
MSRVENIKARLSNGKLKEFHVKASEEEPWQLEFCGVDGSILCFKATDLFEALRAMREDLERDGCQLLCAGARPDVTPSGMSRSMSGGRKAYIVRQGSPASRTDIVDIFDYAEPKLVGTVQQQREYFHAWTHSLRQRL